MTTTTLARSTDPITSKMAGADIEKAEGTNTLQMVLLKQFGKKSMTAESAAEAAGLNPWSGGWKRVSDLRKRGLIEERKQGGKILMWVNRSGKKARVLKITPLGREVLRAAKGK